MLGNRRRTKRFVGLFFISIEQIRNPSLVTRGRCVAGRVEGTVVQFNRFFVRDLLFVNSSPQAGRDRAEGCHVGSRLFGFVSRLSL